MGVRIVSFGIHRSRGCALNVGPSMIGGAQHPSFSAREPANVSVRNRGCALRPVPNNLIYRCSMLSDGPPPKQ